MSALLIYLISRLVIVLGFFFTTFFTAAILRQSPLPPLLQNLQGQPFRWLSGDAELTLPPLPPGTTALLIRAWPLRENLEVEVSIAGEAVQVLRLMAGIHEYVIPLPAPAREASQEGQPLRIALHSAAYSPQELSNGRSLDTRLLAFSLTHLSYFPPDRFGTLELANPALFTRGAYGLEWTGGVHLLSFFRAAMFRWDAAWYESIVERGYTYQAGRGSEQNVRFFPLYPVICRGLQTVVPLPLDLLLWGVANTFAIAAVLVFSDLARKTLAPDAAWCATVLFCFYPGSLFFSLPYTESLMAFLTGLFLWALHQQRFTLAACASGLATACRPTGIALLPALVWAYWVSNPGRPILRGRTLLFGAGLLALSVSGLVAYALYLQWQFDDALAFARTAAALPAWPEDWKWTLASGKPLWSTLVGALWDNPLSLFIVPSAFNALALTGALVLPVAMMKQIPSVWLIVGISLAVMPYLSLGGSTQGVGSMTRFQAVNVPMFLCGGLLLSRYGALRWLPGVVILLALALFVFSSLFATGGYFVG